MFHSFCFDFSVWEMYGALLYGGQLIVIPQTTTLNVPAYHDVLKTERVTILNQTPGAFLQLCEEEKKHTTHDLSLRYVIFGGEALMPGRLRQWNQDYPATRLINMYGITETTVHVTYKEITQAEIQADISNIGVALPPVSVYILNARLKPVPRGVAGEIFVGGEGVARGYLHNPELTQQRFIDDPYRPGKRMYRTGDLGKWTTDGEIEYVGRADQQVKIHGFRIEIGEIESHIRTFQDVTDVIVLPVEDAQGALALCCYVMTTRAHDPYSFIAELKSYLKQHLPVHMLPAFIVPLDDLPLTEHGKLNKAALPDPRQFVDAGEVYVPPRDHMERLLVEIWADVLKLPEEKIGIQSRFFDLGGNSFNVFELHTRVQAMLGKQISMMSYFQYPTIASFVEHLDTPGAALEASSEAQEPEEDVDAIDAYSMMDELTRLAGEE
jgi:acyl-coenzyme A synthetase/AMP-(fatty) acid ligase/acyl carrier protein